jgi:hypothetical protein
MMIRKKLPFIGSYLILTSIILFSEENSKLEQIDIEQLIWDESIIPEGMIIYEKNLCVKEESSNQIMHKRWKRAADTSGLVLVEDTSITGDKPAWSYLRQIWWRQSVKSIEKGKIILEISLLSSIEEAQKRINLYQQAYASVFDTINAPGIGDKTWIPVNPSGKSYALYFMNDCFVVRVYGSMNWLNNQENHDFVISFAKEINISLEKLSSEKGDKDIEIDK